MENQIICPHCQRKISNNPIIEDAAQNKGSGAQSLTCECGERITYWQIAAQLREQQNFGTRIQNWFRGLFKSQN
jgi:23S rRNA A1618 N6-methylase RlmF